jgi:hypothetical protein
VAANVLAHGTGAMNIDGAGSGTTAVLAIQVMRRVAHLSVPMATG